MGEPLSRQLLGDLLGFIRDKMMDVSDSDAADADLVIAEWHMIYNRVAALATAEQKGEGGIRITCTSTHCERRQECASPHECTGSAKYRAVCLIPNCGRTVPAYEPFCALHREARP